MRQSFLAIAFLFSACCQGLSQTQTAFDLRGKTQALHVYGLGPRGSIILSSGDLGWAGFARGEFFPRVHCRACRTASRLRFSNSVGQRGFGSCGAFQP
jgi:hypothetical protein